MASHPEEEASEKIDQMQLTVMKRTTNNYICGWCILEIETWDKDFIELPRANKGLSDFEPGH